MVKEAGGANSPFDLARLRELIELMEQHGVTEINLQHGEEKWRLRRGPRQVVSAPPAYAPAPAVAAAPQPAAPAASADAAKPPAATGPVIKSPTVGTYYASPTPEDPPFVAVGSKVQPDTIVCIVEAMKVFNQIPAETSGTIVELLVNNGDPVEYGQPLFRIATA